MAPRTPTVWTNYAIREERLRERIDARHRELSVQAKVRGRAYRRVRTASDTDEARRLRGDFLAALGRLASFEFASQRFSRTRFGYQVRVHADDLSADYIRLWQLVARRGTGEFPLEQSEDERRDYFATQLGRLEGIADVLILAGRDVRLFGTPNAAYPRSADARSVILGGQGD